jgi:hypothetical protein
MNCINLLEMFGHKYQVDRSGKKSDPWLQIIPAKYGEFYPHSLDLIGFASNSRKIGLRVAKIPGVVILQEAEDGLNVGVDAALFPAVAKIVKPRRRRKVTDKERDRLAKMRETALLRRTCQSATASEAA